MESLSSVGNALRLLSMLSKQPSVRVVDVSRELDVAPSTSHRLLTSLCAAGYLHQAESSRSYVVGPEMLRLARHFSSERTLERAARPHMERLAKEVKETVNLQILLEREVLCVEAVAEDWHTLHVKQIVGSRVAAHATAGGKVLLAMQGSEVRDRLGERDFEPVTSHTITEWSAFEAELSNVRRRGYATNLGELEDGVHAVAVAVRDLQDSPIASLSVAAPAVRLPSARTAGLVRQLHQTAAAVAADYFGV